MKIFGINILTDKQIYDLDASAFDEGYLSGQKNVQNHFEITNLRVKSELERLKKDHWDKDAFDRIINFIENGNK